MTNLTTLQKDQVYSFLKGLSINIDIINLIDIDDIEIDNAYQSIYDMIDSNDGFTKEIIYYSEAMKYLTEKDISLRESLSLASEYGYSLDSLNSETLASILATQNIRQEFHDLESEIEEFFNELAAEIEENENEEDEE